MNMLQTDDDRAAHICAATGRDVSASTFVSALNDCATACGLRVRLPHTARLQDVIAVLHHCGLRLAALPAAPIPVPEVVDSSLGEFEKVREGQP